MGVDPIRDYLKEIARYPLLTGEQELQFARLVQSGITAEAIAEGERSASDRRAILQGQRAKRKSDRQFSAMTTARLFPSDYVSEAL